MFPVSGAPQLNTSGASRDRPISSAMGAYSRKSDNPPPFIYLLYYVQRTFMNVVAELVPGAFHARLGLQQKKVPESLRLRLGL